MLHVALSLVFLFNPSISEAPASSVKLFNGKDLTGWEGDTKKTWRVEDGCIVGFLTFLDHPPVRWVGNVVVAPGKRGSGLGARLVAKALEGAQTAGLYAVEKAIAVFTQKFKLASTAEVIPLEGERVPVQAR